MGVFLYYLPGVTHAAATLERLRASPLAGPLRDCLETSTTYQQRLQFRGVHAHGPDQGSGVIVAPVPPVESTQPIGVHPERQSWQQRGEFWIGTDRHDPPRAIDLARPRQFGGYERQLGGDVWTVPIVRRKITQCLLPSVLSQTPDGQFAMRCRAEWEEAWDISGEIWDQIVHPERRFPLARALTICAAMLGINYRVAVPELSILETIDSDNFQLVYEAVVDWPLITAEMQAMGMTGPADPNETAPGCDQPGATSGVPGPGA